MLRWLLVMVLVGTNLWGAESKRPIFVNLVPRERAVLSAEVTSRVKEIYREMGEIFKGKTPLVVLDDTVSKANYEKAKAQVVTAKAQLASKQSLLVDGGTSIAEVEVARMNLAVAETNRVVALKELMACTLLAPYEGRIVRVLVNRHEVVQPGQKLVEIVDDRVLRAQFLIPATTLKTIRKEQSVAIHIQEVDKTVTGVITHIGAVVDPASSKVKVFAEVQNQDRSIRAGMRGTLTFKTETTTGK